MDNTFQDQHDGSRLNTHRFRHTGTPLARDKEVPGRQTFSLVRVLSLSPT